MQNSPHNIYNTVNSGAIEFIFFNNILFFIWAINKFNRFERHALCQQQQQRQQQKQQQKIAIKEYATRFIREYVIPVQCTPPPFTGHKRREQR